MQAPETKSPLFFEKLTEGTKQRLARTSFVASSTHFEKIIRAASLQLKCSFIGLNESSRCRRFNQSFFFLIPNISKVIMKKLKS